MKKIISIILTLAMLPSIVLAAGQATVFHPDTGHRKVVAIGSPDAFVGGYLLEVTRVEKIDEGLLGFSVVTDYAKNLSSSMSSSQTTVPVTSVSTKDGHTLTMSDLGSKVFLVIEPGRRKEEIVMCTGISGTNWTGCTRGLAFYGKSTAAVAANQKTHNSGSSVIISNTHFIYEELVDKDDDETIAGDKTFTGDNSFSGTNTFTNPPLITNYVLPTADANLAQKKYVDDTAVAGAPDATETVKGNVELATRAEMALGTASGGTSASLVLKSEYATSTPDVATTSVVISDTDGKLKQGWLDLTEDFSLTGDTTLASTTFSATTTFDSVAVFNSSAYGAGFFNREIFTSDGTWTKPSGVTTVYVKVQAAGGGGGGNNSGSTNGDGAGGSGGYCEEIVDVTANTSVNILVGSGGSGSTGGGASADGGLSNFDDFCEASGGVKGAANATTGGAGGTATGGDINITGKAGGDGITASIEHGGDGGDSLFGFGGKGGLESGVENGGNGTGYGAGGGGGVTATSNGGDGADGIVIVYY